MSQVKLVDLEEANNGLSVLQVMRSVASLLDEHCHLDEDGNVVYGRQFWDDLSHVLIDARIQWSKEGT